MEYEIKCEMCRKVLGSGHTRSLARKHAQINGHIIEPECRGNLCLCKDCHTDLTN